MGLHGRSEAASGLQDRGGTIAHDAGVMSEEDYRAMRNHWHDSCQVTNELPADCRLLTSHASGIIMAQLSSNTVADLNTLLSDTYVLALKTIAAHWNVTGPSFQGLHLAFETQYAQLILGADILAERLRALGQPAPSGMKALLEGATLVDAIPGNDGMVLARTLASDHRTLAKACVEAAEKADESHDSATADLLVTRVEEHQKIAWMLEATAA